MNLANLYNKKSNYKKAEEFYIKCKKISEEILQPNHPDLAVLYFKLGNVYSNRADYDIAEEFYTKCVKIEEELLPQSYPGLADVYEDMEYMPARKRNTTELKSFI